MKTVVAVFSLTESILEKLFHRRELASLKWEVEHLRRMNAMPKAVTFEEVSFRHWWSKNKFSRLDMQAGDSFEITVRENNADYDLVPVVVRIGVGATMHGVCDGKDTYITRIK